MKCGATILITVFVWAALVIARNYLFFEKTEAATAATSVVVTVSQCSDSSDNDGDGLIDYPADPGCDSAVDDDETNVVASAPTPTVTVGGGGFSISPTRQPLPPRILSICDFNTDNRCNIIDFSIMLYHFNKPIAIASRYDLNSDGKLDIVDISILLYHWV